jgi:hypothetical protein
LSLFDGSGGGRSGGCGPFSASGGGFSCRPSVDGRVMIGKLSVHAAKKGKKSLGFNLSSFGTETLKALTLILLNLGITSNNFSLILPCSDQVSIIFIRTGKLAFKGIMNFASSSTQ